MKAATLFRSAALGLLIIPFLFSCLSVPQQQAQARDSGDAALEAYSREELAQMLAPIALYPDTLLSQVLMASTYPIEVVEADRWAGKNQGLRDEDLDAVLLDMDWDPSVKAMCHFPSILSLMSERITETTRLGNAFLAQEAEVMDMVQELRAKAYAQNHLRTNSQQRIIVENETIVIEPADPKVIYVSYYDPMSIYGPWWYPAYPPYYWGPRGVRGGVGLSYWPGFYFGFAFGTWSYFDWHHHNIHIDVDRRPRYVRHDRWIENPGRWHHAPDHRRGAAYRDESTARKYGQFPRRPGEFQRNSPGFPEKRDVYRDRHIDDRNRFDPSKHGNERLKIDRDRREQERIKREHQGPQQIERGKQEQQQIDRVRQERERVEHGRREQQQIDRARQEREGVERGRREQLQIDRVRQGREGVERGRREQLQIDRVRQGREGFERGKREQQRVDRGHQERERGEIGKQGQQGVDLGRPERERIERGNQEQQQIERGRQEKERVEREQQQKSGGNVSTPGDDSRGKGRLDHNDRGNRDDRGHGRRQFGEP